MKPFLLILSFLVSPFVVLSQGVNENYHPFIEEGKVWKVAVLRNEIIPGDYWIESYYLGGDTIIAGVHCKKMMHGEAKYSGAVYEEGMKVWYFAPGSQSEALLYDFGVKEGDTVTPLMDYLGGDETYSCVVTDILTVQNDGENLRCIFLSPQEGMDYSDQIFGVWVEGIGSTVCPVADVPLIMTPVGQALHECYVGEKGLYSSGLRLAVYDAMQEVEVRKTAIHDISDPSFTNHQIFDLSGRCLNTSPTRHGVYIKNGKKVEVKYPRR